MQYGVKLITRVKRRTEETSTSSETYARVRIHLKTNLPLVSPLEGASAVMTGAMYENLTNAYIYKGIEQKLEHRDNGPATKTTCAIQSA